MKKYFGIVILIFSLLYVGCKSDSVQQVADGVATSADTSGETESPITKLSNEMPPEFKALSIPLIEGSEIDRANKHNHNTGDKFQITFSCKKTPKEIEEYYLETMKGKGWKVTNYTRSPRGELKSYFSICNNGEKQLIVNAVPNQKNDESTASLILMDMPVSNTKVKEE